jgi:hypothetical protein
MTIELKRAVRLALAPVACAALLSGCSFYERQVVHRNTTASPPVATVTTTSPATTVTTVSTFDQLDTNRDGFLSRGEVDPLGLPSHAAAGLSFEHLDTNRDGFLSRAEAQSLMNVTRMSSGRWIIVTSRTASFENLDADRDGFLNRNEASPVMNAATFERHDTNRDGFLSRAEADLFFRANVGSTEGSSGGTVYGPR